ncbi:unnamed protein product [Amaranthus hypochondriacus]
MEGRNRSGSRSDGVVKNRNSSGCLIIKKKSDGVGGLGSSKGSKQSKKEKKRAKLDVSDSMSSDDEELLELFPKHGVRGRTGASLVYENDDFEDRSFAKNGLMRDVVPKGRMLDIYDFDEYDDLSEIEMSRINHHDSWIVGGGESGSVPGMKDDREIELESGSSKGDIIYKRRRNSFHGGFGINKIRSGDIYSGKRRFDMRNELAVSSGKGRFGVFDDAIRLQGKNGVLKVKVKHNEDVQIKGNNVGSRSQQSTSKKIGIHSSPFVEKNLPKKPTAFNGVRKNQQRKRKPLPTESSEENDEEAEDSDMPPKLQSESASVHPSKKRGRDGGSMQSPKKAQPIKMKEGKVKRGSGTEKQLLREKIRSMLIDAGWTIDYRPRRGRDYSDAVYVNPTGTAYWSIIKAYDALQKQLEEEGNSMKASVESSSFAPISEDVLSKLTRQTRKKMEKELKRKKREESGGKGKKSFGSDNFDEDESDTYSGGSGRHDDKLCSFIKRSGKTTKGSTNSKMLERGQKSSSMSNRFVHGKKSRKIGRCMLLVRHSERGLDSESDGFIPYTGKRNLLSWLIDSGTVELSEKVHYMNRRCTRVMLEGWITREGIHCGCCSKILTVSKFEIHAGSKLRQPYQNIYLGSGASLMQCQIDAWNKQEECLRSGYNKIDVNGDDPNDDTCAICGDGGNLICCDSCPSTFHQNCLGIEMLPPGDWHCPHCSCKFCGLADMSFAEGSNGRQDAVLTCNLCEGKYHSSCVEEMDITPNNYNNPPFCGKTCQELSERLQKLLGVKHELEAGLVWSLIYRTDLGSDSSVPGFPQRVEWNSKLAVALNVMDECFLPIIDRRSGINMIHSVLFNRGSNITRLNYSSYYTAILEKGDEIVSAASIRIRGTDFAEMPFIGTRHIYRRQGMCRRLFSAIESALRSLKVERLIIPAISELMDTWTTVFGFCTFKESDKQDTKIGNMLVFPGTDMLQKKLLDQDSLERGSAGADSFENGLNASVVPGLRKESDLDSPPGPSSAALEPDDEEMKDASVTDFGSKDIVCSDGNFLHGVSADHCEEVNPTLATENEEEKDKSVLDFGSVDMICTNEIPLQGASADCFGGVKSLPSENERMKDKSVADNCSEGTNGNFLHVDKDTPPPLLTENDKNDKAISDFGSEDMICKNEISASAADCFVGIDPLPTKNEGMKIKSVADIGTEDIICSDRNSLHGATDNCELKPSSPAENEEIKGEAVAYFGSEDMAQTDGNHLHGVSDYCEEVKPPLPTENMETKEKSVSPCSEEPKPSLPTENVEAKSTSDTDGSQDRVLPEEKYLCNASTDCCKEVETLPTASSHECSDEKSTENEERKDPCDTDFASQVMVYAEENVVSNALSNCCEDGKSLPSVSPCNSNNEKPSLHVVSDRTSTDSTDQPKNSASRIDFVSSQIREAMPIDDVPCRSPQDPSDSTVVIEKTTPDSYSGITEQPTLEGDGQHFEVDNVQPSDSSWEGFVNNEVPPSICDIGNIGAILPATKLNDQSPL